MLCLHCPYDLLRSCFSLRDGVFRANHPTSSQENRTRVFQPERLDFESQICLLSATYDLEFGNEFAYLKNWEKNVLAVTSLMK